MTRMWCVFELAAFAKRGSLSRMDIIPLHTSMQIGALAIILFPYQFVLIASSSNLTDEQSSQGMIAMMHMTIPIIMSPLLLIIWATYCGRATSRAIDELRYFSLADAECYSQVDRDAITELIGRWFADAGEGEAVGIHNFEMLVRNDVHEKVSRAVGKACHDEWRSACAPLGVY